MIDAIVMLELVAFDPFISHWLILPSFRSRFVGDLKLKVDYFVDHSAASVPMVISSKLNCLIFWYTEGGGDRCKEPNYPNDCVFTEDGPKFSLRHVNTPSPKRFKLMHTLQHLNDYLIEP